MSESIIPPCEFPASANRDALTLILREGAQQMLATAIEAEVAEWIAGRASGFYTSCARRGSNSSSGAGGWVERSEVPLGIR